MSYSTITPNTTQITFLRHGESTGNAENRHQGQADFPLTEQGISEANALCSRWSTAPPDFDLIISSPLQRARKTAEIIANCFDLEVVYDPVWKERDNGKLAGLLHDEAKDLVPAPDFIPRYQPVAETGESQWELFLRAGNAVNSLMKHQPGNYLIVSHGGLLNMVLHAIFGIVPLPNFQGPNFRFSNTGYSKLLYKPEKENWILMRHNLTDHLTQSGLDP